MRTWLIDGIDFTRGTRAHARRPRLRTAALAALLAALATACASETKSHGAPAAPGTLDPLARLQEGNARFVAGAPTAADRGAGRRAEVAQGQHPFAIIVCCSDSRVGPEVVFDQGLGDIFVVRTAGEVVDDVGLGSIEYAAEHLHVPLILVLGHQRCGAVDAAVSGAQPHDHLASVLAAIQPAVAKSQGEPGDKLDNAVRAQVRHVVEELAGSQPVLAEEVKAGHLKVVGARYDLDTGKVELLP